MSEVEEKRDMISERLGELIFGIRWTQVVMYVGLWVAMIGYDIKFIRELFLFTFGMDGWIPFFRLHHSSEWLLWILNLLDITLVGNLIVMITVGGYATFVKPFSKTATKGRPEWMIGLDRVVFIYLQHS